MQAASHYQEVLIIGCALTEQGLLRVNEQYQTTVPGVFAAGDCCSAIRQLAGAIAAGNMAGAHFWRLAACR